jgi:hypothetical protein
MPEWDQSEIDPAAYEEQTDQDERAEDDPADDEEPEEDEPEDPATAGFAFAERLRVALTEVDNILAEAPEETEVSEIERARDELSVAVDHLLPDEAPEGWEPAR